VVGGATDGEPYVILGEAGDAVGGSDRDAGGCQAVGRVSATGNLDEDEVRGGRPGAQTGQRGKAGGQVRAGGADGAGDRGRGDAIGSAGLQRSEGEGVDAPGLAVAVER
jgi:hypothetical protein